MLLIQYISWAINDHFYNSGWQFLKVLKHQDRLNLHWIYITVYDV